MDNNRAMDLISIIVPVYKVEEYLDCCVQSIVNQSFKNLEIILVDDGSPDNCPKMCDEWARRDSRIKVIHKTNGGLADARNAGIDAAIGEYYVFVDSDDWLDIDFCKVLYSAIKKYNAQIAASDVVFCYEDHEERMAKYDQVCFTSAQALKTIIRGEGFHSTAWNKLYKAELFKTIRYPLGKLHEDEFVTYKVICEAERLVLCQETSYYYRQRSGSIMTSADIRHLDAVDAFLERLEYFKINYPALYVKDKPGFCILLVGLYKNAINGGDIQGKAMRQKLLSYRKKVSYTAGEFFSYSLKQKMYVLGTALSLDLFSKALLCRGKK